MAAIPIQRVEEELQTFHNSLWADWDEPAPGHLHHYTSIAGMRGILEASTFWASDIRYMNDTSEGGYGLVFNVLAGRRDILGEGLTCNCQHHRGIPDFGKTWFRYAVCFCGARDLLSQWRGYTPPAKVLPLGYRSRHSGCMRDRSLR